MTTAPNPWLAFAASGATGLSNGTPPNPLESDTFATQSAPTALPSPCAVPTGILGTQPSLSEADETIVYADPLQDHNYNPTYATSLIKHYYLDGVGEVCNKDTNSQWWLTTGPLDWDDGADRHYNTVTSTTYTYVTTTSLTATYSHVRNFALALPATTQAFTATTYALIRAQMHNNQNHSTQFSRSFGARSLRANR